MNNRMVVAFAAAFVVVIGGTGWLYAHSKTVGRIESVEATPSDVVVNAPTSVEFKAVLSDSSLRRHDPLRVVLVRTDDAGKPIDVLGRMIEQGKRFKHNRSDPVYALRLRFQESEVGPMYFRVATLFRSKPSFSFRTFHDDDDDWDRELRTLNDPRHRGSRHSRLGPLLRKFLRYELSDVFQVAVVPFALPPDPGETGNQTLPGIDSDGDGVRDDFQRYLAVEFLDNPAAYAAGRQYARAMRDVMTATDFDEAVSLAERVLAADYCLASTIGVRTAYAMKGSFHAQYLNTSLRQAHYSALQRQLQGAQLASPQLDELGSFCHD